MAGRQTKFDASINYYEVLNVPYTATRTEIVRAYRSLMRYAHPDRFSTELERQKAEERAKLLNAAYAVLSKPEIRREYDSVIRHRAVSDAIMQRYTGNTPGRPSPFHTRRDLSPRTRRAQAQASRSALWHLILISALFLLGLIVVLLLANLIPQIIEALIR